MIIHTTKRISKVADNPRWHPHRFEVEDAGVEGGARLEAFVDFGIPAILTPRP